MYAELIPFSVFFCTQGYKPPDEAPSEYQSIPLNKIEDFGVHCKKLVAGLGFCSPFSLASFLFLSNNGQENNGILQ